MSLCLLAAVEGQPLSFAAPGFSAHGVSDKTATYFSEQLAQQLSGYGLKVMTANELQALLGLERQKQLMGCSDDNASCLTELANALGTDGLIRGAIGKFGELFQLDLKVLAAKDGQTLASFSSRAEGEQALLLELDRGSRELAQKVYAHFKRLPPEALTKAAATQVVRSQAPGRPLWVYLVGAAGLLAGGGGTLALVRAGEDAAELRDPAAIRDLDLSINDARDLSGSSTTQRTAGLALVGVGGAALVGAVVAFVLHSPPSAQVASAPLLVPGGTGFQVAGVLPW